MIPRHVIPEILEALARVPPSEVDEVLRHYPPADRIDAADLAEVRAWFDDCLRRLTVPTQPARRRAWLAKWLEGEHKLLTLNMRRYAVLRQYGPAGMDQWEIGYDGSWDGKPLSLLRALVWWLDASRKGIALHRARVIVAMQEIESVQNKEADDEF